MAFSLRGWIFPAHPLKDCDTYSVMKASMSLRCASLAGRTSSETVITRVQFKYYSKAALVMDRDVHVREC